MMISRQQQHTVHTDGGDGGVGGASGVGGGGADGHVCCSRARPSSAPPHWAAAAPPHQHQHQQPSAAVQSTPRRRPANSRTQHSTAALQHCSSVSWALQGLASPSYSGGLQVRPHLAQPPSRHQQNQQI